MHRYFFGMGIDPSDYKEKHGFKLQRSLGINPDQYTHHNALEDVKMLRDVYVKLQGRVDEKQVLDLSKVLIARSK